MDKINLNCHEIMNEIMQQKNHINSVLLPGIESDFNQMINTLDLFDGSANASLKGAFERNKEKNTVAISGQEIALTFIDGVTKVFINRDKENANAISFNS